MKLALFLLITTAIAQAAPINKINLLPVTKAESIAVKSAQLIELKFKVQDPKRGFLKWHYELEEGVLHNEFSRMITYK